jgi:hypothetical protein
MERKMSFQRIALFFSIFHALLLSGCGGGGGSGAANNTTSNAASVVAADYLSKYQGTWTRCVAEMSSAPMSVREKLVVSAPLADGSIQMESIEEIFENYTDCQNPLAVPLATLSELVSSSGKFGYTQTLVLGAIPGYVDDVLSIHQPQTNVLASGAKVSQMVVNGVPTWRVRSTGTSVVDRPVTSAEFTGEVGFMFSNSGVWKGLFLNDDLRAYTKAPI